MTYLKFHLIFNLPLLIGAGILAGLEFFTAPVLFAFGIVLLAVMIFTTPWDNYAVAQGIWGFPRERFSLKIWHLPIEEYGFFIIESVQVMLLCLFLFQTFPDLESIAMTRSLVGMETLLGIMAIFIIWGAVGLWGKQRIHKQSRFHYAWHLFFWFLPVIFLQWVIGWEILLPRWEVLAGVTFLIGTYLSLADYWAIDKGIWHFDQRQITGFKFGNKMPWEEAAFFYLTAFLVAQSFTLLLPEGLR